MTRGNPSPLLGARKDCYHRSISAHQTTYTDILRADVAAGKKTPCEAVRWMKRHSSGMDEQTAIMLITNGVV